MKISDQLIGEFCVARSFINVSSSSNSPVGDGDADIYAINSMDFSLDGLSLIGSSAKEDQILVYDVGTGTQKKFIHSQKYGVDHIKFTHDPTKAIHSSTKVNDDIRLNLLYQNNFLRYFKGHTDKVTALSMSPKDPNVFISGGLDKTIKSWDFRAHEPTASMNLQPGKILADFDPEGIIFGVAHESQIKLYDTRKFTKGAFMIFTFSNDERNGQSWSDLRFTPNGKAILLNTNQNELRLIDAFKGGILRTFSTNGENEEGSILNGCFTPDSQYCLAGSSDGKIHIWKLGSENKVGVLNSGLTTPIRCVEFNPGHAMMVTASSYLNMWLPANIDRYLSASRN